MRCESSPWWYFVVTLSGEQKDHVFNNRGKTFSIHICDCQIGDRDVRDFIYKYYVYMQGSSVEGIHNFFVASKWLSNPSSLGNLGLTMVWSFVSLVLCIDFWAWSVSSL